ncbi:putative short-chain dehydrogenase [Heliocybe sulcata]|uniref:Putative short-chain dehydrogenase n=1 Tax=Heliocybe sulcata TaxID=5364 RepID=A0A5C3MQU5_9AGAM|nr:putative short-chain dehydrogenase [Heliocybe sulcata]
MSYPRVLLVLGAGPRVGLKVARKFAGHGYKVALAARNPSEEASKTGDLLIRADFSDPSAVSAIFDKVKTSLGIPSVVVYNASSCHNSPSDEPLSVPVSDFITDLTVNTISAFIAAQETIKGFDQLPSDVPKTFIYTGNILNVAHGIMPAITNAGVGKSATAHFIASAAIAYPGKGYSFYYADERKADGQPVVNAIDGDAHGDFYYELAQDAKQRPWLATFVKGKGYVHFPVHD